MATFWFQSCRVVIPAQAEELVTNWVGLGKQKETMFGFTEMAARWCLKSDKQVEEVFRSGRKNIDVSLRCSARPMPKMLESSWQQKFLLTGSLLQIEVFQGMVLT